MGEQYTGSGLVETWDGTTWRLGTAPSGDGVATLANVSCTSASSCMAVGNAFVSSSSTLTLAERYDGSSWTLLRPPSDAFAVSYLESVSCVATSCDAVGYVQGASSQRTLAERWNGTTWRFTVSTNPYPTGTGDSLHGISCVASSRCVAVGGGSLAGNTKSATIVEGWNGTTWSTETSANPDHGDELIGVACRTASFCRAVGQRLDAASLIEANH